MGRLRLTKTGVYTIGLTLLVGLAAINTLNNMLFLAFGALLSVILTSGLVSEQTLFRLRVTRSLPRIAFAGEPCPFEVKVRSTHKWFPAYALEVEEGSDNDESEKRCFFLKVDPGQTQSATYRKSFAKRGIVAMQGVWLRTSFPFGMFEKAQWVQAPDELVVYPAIDDTTDLKMDAGDSPHERTREGTGEDIVGARDFREGDDPRDVLWARSSAGNGIVVRVRQDDDPARVEVHLRRAIDNTAVGLENFERHVSECATRLVRARERGLQAALHSDAGRVLIQNDDGLRTALHYLAVVEPDASGAQP